MRGFSFLLAGSLVSVAACGGSETGGNLFGSGSGGVGAAAGKSADASAGSSGRNGTSGRSGTGARPSSSGGDTGDASSDSQSSQGGNDGLGAGGSSSGGATSSGGASNGGSSGQGGSGGTSPGGTSGQGGSGGACQPKTWCKDADGDGFGDPAVTQLACTQPSDKWKEDCSDCHDGNPDVHPGADCRGAAYVAADGVTMSFDYDCDGHETECGTFVKANASGCGVVGPLNCAGGGYLPNPNRTATGNQNAYCGSTAYRNCVSVGLPCVAQATTKTAVVCH